MKTSVVFTLFLTLIFFSVSPILSQTDNPAPKTEPKVCIVSGETIEEGMGAQFTYLGKTYDFCCKHCVAKFKNEPMNYIKEEMKCPVGGEASKKEVSAVVDGVKYYFCCENCIKKFTDNPDKYLKKE